jgi:hypothetical protein
MKRCAQGRCSAWFFLTAAIAQQSRRSPDVRRLAVAGGANCGLRGNSGTLKFKGVPDPPGN